MRSRDVPSVSDETTRDRLPELRIGAPVHARDGRCGTLEKVVGSKRWSSTLIPGG
jgi:hypothetical protein